MNETKHVDIILISQPSEVNTISNIAKKFSYSFKSITSVEAILEETVTPSLLVVSEFTETNEVAVDELIQISRQQFPQAYLILIVEKELTKERFNFLSKLGAKTVLLKKEITTAKVSFAINQILKAGFIPLKPVDLAADIELPFAVFHLIPYSKKFLQLTKAGEKLSRAKLDKFLKGPELYIQRLDNEALQNFIKNTVDKSAKGLAKRCRANFVALQEEFTNLVFDLTDESNRVSFGEGQALLNRCERLCEELLMNLAEFPKAWEIINNSSIGEFGSLERSPAIAAYCGMFALNLEVKDISTLMLAALLVDIGITSLNDSIADKLRTETNLNEDELKDYKRVPQKSLDMILARKVALNEKLRNILLGVYERADGKGYPKGLFIEKLTIESQMIRLAKIFDQKTMLKLGGLRENPLVVLKSMLADEDNKKSFASSFLLSVDTNIIQSELFTEYRNQGSGHDV